MCDRLFPRNYRISIDDVQFIFEGIGKSICIALAKAGAQTFALGKTKENLDALVSEVGTPQLCKAF